MHELSIASSIMGIVLESLPANKGKHVKTVQLKVGELAAVVPESLEFCFEAITTGTPLEGAKLEIQHVGITVICKKCGKESSVISPDFCCRHCNSSDTEIVSGTELQVTAIEIED
ncbi:MAG: hydrogenase maturation nickel metallochaperone HypA [Candidatus Kryptoniota bacterium]